jgi:hypothetical protein
MSVEAEIARLEAEWSADDGFLWLLRQGEYDALAYDPALRKFLDLSIARVCTCRVGSCRSSGSERVSSADVLKLITG